MSIASYKAAQIIKCINAFVSCIASTFIMLMILTEPKTGLASPYSRIIFALSISDILFSLGHLLSPFLGPKDNSDALFAIGTTETCEAIGFIFIIGFQCLLFYTLFLTYYFMRRVKYKVTPQNFAKKEEKFFHVIFILIALTLAIAAVVTGSINPQGKGNICGLGTYPPVCDYTPDMVCERGDGKATKVLLTIFGASVIVTFITLIVILVLFTHHVYREERTFTIPAREIGRTVDRSRDYHNEESVEVEQAEENVNEDRNEESVEVEQAEENVNEDRNEESVEVEQAEENVNATEENVNEIEENVNETEEIDAVRANRKAKNRLVLTKQAFLQSLLYVLAFILVYTPPLTGLILRRFANEKGSPMWKFWLSALLTPLTGVFNILIYTRPKVLKLKETLPNASTFELLTVIVLSGGEIPSMADLLQAITASRHHHGDELQGEVQEGQFEDDRWHYRSEDAISDPSYSSNDSLISYDLDVSSEVELLKRMKESGQSLFSVMRQQR
ncbi:hypothetical protein CTEN210_18257 [Chaetoceros tenuissimus]|uniref:G-protein coupled receptors family 1 profile domain-containing protein n=1 Tax=Chaetoceros tenuissimus TaxID=426638 RepID=A0AAD3DCG9_9STRA|nr:hypothetical protein CTEN210_18257 [Chaetoceros tenuissimus]